MPSITPSVNTQSPVITKDSDKKSEYYGWNMISSKDFGIKFEFPQDWQVVPYHLKDYVDCSGTSNKKNNICTQSFDRVSIENVKTGAWFEIDHNDLSSADSTTVLCQNGCSSLRYAISSAKDSPALVSNNLSATNQFIYGYLETYGYLYVQTGMIAGPSGEFSDMFPTFGMKTYDINIVKTIAQITKSITNI